ncbi:MAG: hypothetical protein E5X11_14290 [Mesorhizobium sp.]|nr:MAG: hypothetical protein E5X11_14290 [Mesorhizobium sp.]
MPRCVGLNSTLKPEHGTYRRTARRTKSLRLFRCPHWRCRSPSRYRRPMTRFFSLRGATALENWTLHDLRRTLATNLGRRQVLPHVIEHILNHKAASLTDISEIYNLYTYVKQKREALQMWSNHIEWLIKQAAEMDALAA